jgi:hypothetical protein
MGFWLVYNIGDEGIWENFLLHATSDVRAYSLLN